MKLEETINILKEQMSLINIMFTEEEIEHLYRSFNSSEIRGRKETCKVISQLVDRKVEVAKEALDKIAERFTVK